MNNTKIDAATNINILDDLPRLDPLTVSTQYKDRPLCQVSLLMPNGKDTLDTACYVDCNGRIIITNECVLKYLYEALCNNE